MKRIVVIAAAVMATLALPAHAAPGTIANSPGRYAPRDECTQLSGGAAFRAQLARAVARRDAAAFVALAAPRITLGFDGSDGRMELRRLLTGSRRAAFWRGIDEILRLGCGFEHGAMVFPWVFTQEIGDLDVFSVYLVKGASVPLYAAGGRNARVLNRISWQMIQELGGYNEGAAFQRVELIGTGQRGYVETAMLRSIVDLRLHVERVGGVWRMTSLVAGD